MTIAGALATRTRRCVLFLMCAAVLGLAFTARANAAFSGRLPAYEETASGAEYNMTGMYGEEYEYRREICIGPSRWNGSSYVWVYGPECKTNVVTFGFPDVIAHIGVYNPNNATIWFQVEPT